MNIQATLSTPMAVLINLNIMFGSGIFINTAILATKCGSWGALSYVLIGILLLPLVITMSRLVTLYPHGSFYAYSANELTPFLGFISCWSYFISKLASAALIIHIAMILCQRVIAPLSLIPTTLLDILILTIFVALNMKNTRTGTTVQGVFMAFKIIPLFFAILIGLYCCFFYGFAPSETHPLIKIPLSLPLVLYALLGFEATCSLSSHIRNAAINGPRIILGSYTLAIITATLYQFSFYAPLGNLLAQAKDYTYIFPLLLSRAFPLESATLSPFIIPILHLGIAASALGGSYGIIFSNAWNLHCLAINNTLVGSSWLMQLNKNSIAYLCVIAEGIICALYFVISHGNQIILQQISALGCSAAYGLSALALLAAHKRLGASPIIPILGIINSLFLISLCLYNLAQGHKGSLTIFALLMILGCISYGAKRTQLCN